MKKLIAFTFFIFSSYLPGMAQKKDKEPTPEKTRMVVGIIVDQMRADYIDRFWSKFGEDGFKRLVREGYSCTNANFNYVPTYTGPGHASVYTGTTPAVHGIVANNWYSRDEKNPVYCAEDKTVKSVGTTSKAGLMSPRRLLAPTICDAIKLANGNKGISMGIALKDRGAVLPAGLTANAAYWLDDSNGAWITSSYYMANLPKWAVDFNKEDRVKKYISEDWNTLLPVSEYTESWGDDTPYEMPYIGESKPVFPHRIPQLMKYNGNLAIIRATPFGNDITMDFAEAALDNEAFGDDEFTDLLAISFSSTDYVGHSFGTGSVELEDTYIRLDKRIAGLLSKLDKKVGKGKYLLFLTADHGASDNFTYLTANKIPSGTINDSILQSNLNASLLKMFADTVMIGMMNQQVYLNHDVIKSLKLDESMVLDAITSALLRTPGIAYVYSRQQIIQGCSSEGPLSFVQAGFAPTRSGDLAFVLSPGWAEWPKAGTTHGSHYSYDTHVPMIFFGKDVSFGKTESQVHPIDIVVTVADLLKILPPAGATGKVIPLK